MLKSRDQGLGVQSSEFKIRIETRRGDDAKRRGLVSLPRILASSPLLLFIFALFACGPAAALVDMGLITPTPVPDPYSHYRAFLQPWAQSDIEAAAPLPQYHITAQLDESGTLLTGVMQVIVPSPGPELVFRLYPNLDNYGGAIDVTQTRINGTPAVASPIANGTAVQLTVPKTDGTLPDTVTIDMAFATQLPRNNGDYTLFGWQDSILSLPGFYPTLAVKQNGEWVLDNPPEYADVLFNEVALYQLDITLPKDLVVAAGGVTLNVIDNPNQTRTWQITGGPLRDMTVVAGPFQASSKSAAGATVTSYYMPQHEAAGLAALFHTTASLRLYSDHYGPYPYTELDIVEAPLGFRGMEYSGLVLIGSDMYQEQREFLPFLVTHEVGHQWWYALVGNNPYQHPWLDEGLSEYSAFDYYRGVFGQGAAEELLTGRWEIPFNWAASGGVDGTVDQPAADFDPVSYELLVYSKSALFFNALRQQLGDEMYLKVLQTYYVENRYKIATPQTFLATAERVSGQNLNALAEEWLK